LSQVPSSELNFREARTHARRILIFVRCQRESASATLAGTRAGSPVIRYRNGFSTAKGAISSMATMEDLATDRAFTG